MASGTLYRISHPQAWQIIAAYGAVVIGVTVFSIFNHESGGRFSNSSTSVASADAVIRFAHPYISATRRSTASIE